MQPPDTRTLTFAGSADLRAGSGLRLGASLEDPNARGAIPHVTYDDLDPYNRTPIQVGSASQAEREREP